MKIQMVKIDFQKPPEEILNYLKNKGFKLTFDYDELIKEAHHRTFTVAKVTRADLLNDIFNSLATAMEEGKSFKDFKEDIIPTLEKKGWWGKKEILNPITGEVKEVQINSRRLKTIYNVNMRVAHQRYRFKQMMQLPTSTFWMYRSALLETTRTSHEALHRTVLPRDHIFWATNYPPNDWNCKCTVTAHSAKDLEKRGLKVHTGVIDSIASKDWAYNIGDTSKISTISKLDLSNVSKLRDVKKNKAYENLSDTVLLNTFFKKLGVKEGDVYIDKVNDPMIIDNNLFLDKRTKKLKINKEDRHLLLDEFVETLIDPDEIYLEHDKNGFKKNMFRYITIDGKKEAILAVFRYFKDKTQGATIFHVTRDLEKRREMKLIYSKEKPE